ncbi:MAG: class II aldolase/adducin family protein [Burkholderiaceae bacterium]|nr:class II aldolase/adducin family protein [Burkholderiaceae bacterium]
MSAAGVGPGAPASSLSAPETELAARTAIIATYRRAQELGINQGSAGNVSLRWHRGGLAGMLVTPAGLGADELGAADIVWLGLDDPQPEAGARAPSSEWRLHRDLYLARPEFGAIVHAHSSFAASLSCLPEVQREGVPAFHYMIAAAGGNDIRCARYETFGTQELSRALGEAMAGRGACLMSNHGQTAAGSTLRAALALALEVETLCRMYWQASQLGEPQLLDDEDMARVRAQFAARAASAGV